MKTILTIIAIVFTAVAQNAAAAEWSIFGKETPLGTPVTATVPVGSGIVDSRASDIATVTLTLESVSVTGATFRSENRNSSSGIAIFAPLEGGSTIRPRLYKVAYPALRIKVLSVDVEKGLARLEVSQFWPYPNEAKIESAK